MASTFTLLDESEPVLFAFEQLIDKIPTKKIKNSSSYKDFSTSILPVKTFKFKLEKSNGDMIYGNMNRCRIINFDGVVMTMLVDNLTILKN